MGWMYDDPDHPECYDHEGRIAALTYRAPDRSTRLFRELGYPDDEERGIPVARIKAACSCGWRSSYILPHRGPYGHEGAEVPAWSPFSVTVSERDEERCRELWREHLGAVVPGLPT